MKVTCYKNYASIELPIHFVIFFKILQEHVSVLFGSEDSAMNVTIPNVIILQVRYHQPT